MKNLTHFTFIFLFVFFVTCITGIQAATQGTAFTYQGNISTVSGPITGNMDFEFALFDDAGAGSQVGSTVTKDDILVTDGLFTVDLDFGAAAFQGEERYMEIRVRDGASAGAYSNMSPRQKLQGTPYAIGLRPGVIVENPAGTGITAKTGSSSGSAIHGISNSSSGNSVGVYGESSAPTGAGVAARVGTSADKNYGVFAVSEASIGEGVHGEATHLTGGNIGVKGVSNSVAGFGVQGVAPFIGVYGIATHPTYSVYGLYGSTSSTDSSAAGVRAIAAAATGETSAIRADNYSESGIGVKGFVDHATGLTIGVKGVSSSINGTGVYGEGGTYGVSGKGTDTSGVTHGVYGEINSTSNSSTAVFGKSEALTGENKGVLGENYSSSGFGVSGIAYSSSGINYGVYGKTNSSSGYGIYSDGKAYVNGTTYMNGAAHVDGELSWKSKAGYVSVPASAFQPTTAVHTYINVGYELQNTSFIQLYYTGPIYLPHNATLTKMTGFWLDPTDDYQVIYKLYRTSFDGTTEDIAIVESPVIGGNASGETTFFTSSTVDNSQYGYYLEVNLADSSLRARGVVIEYTTTGPH